MSYLRRQKKKNHTLVLWLLRQLTGFKGGRENYCLLGVELFLLSLFCIIYPFTTWLFCTLLKLLLIKLISFLLTFYEVSLKVRISIIGLPEKNCAFLLRRVGVGFRSLHDIYISFAAKAWWTFRTQNSLLNLILQAKYCKRSHHVSKS